MFNVKGVIGTVVGFFSVLGFVVPILFLGVLGAIVGQPERGQPTGMVGGACGGAAAVSVDTANLPTVSGFTAEQVWAAAYILKAGDDAGVGARGQLISLMVAMQESNLGSSPGWDRPNGDGDAGFFQQRTLPGWYGSVQEVTDPYTGAMKFLKGVTVEEKHPGGNPVGYHIPGLVNVEGWQGMSLDRAAHQVQRSAYPQAILKHESRARDLIQALGGGVVGELPAAGSACGGDIPVQPVDGIPTQDQFAYGSVKMQCPAGSIDIGIRDGAYRGKHVPQRLCAVQRTMCTGESCHNGNVVFNAVAAPYFMEWLRQVRALGYEPVFSSSWRSWEKQYSISGSSNAASTGWSHHQTGTAVDLVGLKGAGGTLAYSKKACPGQTADGSCFSISPEWKDYHRIALSLGGAFHPQEWWHLEWSISHKESRNLPF